MLYWYRFCFTFYTGDIDFNEISYLRFVSRTFDFINLKTWELMIHSMKEEKKNLFFFVTNVEINAYVCKFESVKITVIIVSLQCYLLYKFHDCNFYT